jgi:hypothetical protein
MVHCDGAAAEVILDEAALRRQTMKLGTGTVAGRAAADDCDV